MAFDLSNIPENSHKKAESKEESIWEKELFSFSSSFSKKLKENFYLELGILLDSGIALKEALELVSRGIKKKKPQGIINNMVAELIEGSTLSDAMKKQKVFTEYEVQSVKIGEETASLNQVVLSLADFFKSSNTQRKELISALTYPAIVMITAVLVVYFMLNFVVPIFQDLFKRNNTELPWITKIVISASDFLNSYGLPLLLTIAAVILFFRLIKKNSTYQKYSGILIMNLPFVGKIAIRNYMSRFINAMSLLSRARINITQSLELIKGMIPFYPLNQALEQINRDLINGDTQSQAFGKHPKLFDEKLIAMIQVAEQTNQDELIYENLKQRYNNLLMQQTKTFTNLINPILTLIVGFIVGFILIALYLPMFKMSTLIG